MKDFIRLTDYSSEDVYEIFKLADAIRQGKHGDVLNGKTVVLFFPMSSIRTRVTFEKGIACLGGQSILFPPESLDKKEDLKDLCGYLDNWADLIVVRHKDIQVVEKIAKYSKKPVINAMTDNSHPCEVLTDLYALSKIRKNLRKDEYLFCGMRGNIGLTWRDASKVMGFPLCQCCAAGYEIEGIPVYHNIYEAVKGKDIICTDSLPAGALADFKDCQVTMRAMEQANKGAILNPCPPFFRGEEVSAEVVESSFFAGYEFKKYLLEVQQAVMASLLL